MVPKAKEIRGASLPSAQRRGGCWPTDRFSVYGYTVIHLLIQAALKAGPNLTTDSFIKAMDTMVIPPDMFGSAPSSYSATSASAASRLPQSLMEQAAQQSLSPDQS